MREGSLQEIYVTLLGECVDRLAAAGEFLDQFRTRPYVPLLEAAILQVRKSLELIAIAAIAPDKMQYEAFRATASQDPGFTKDYHAAKIFAALENINPDSYPRPLMPAVRKPDGSSHCDDKKSDVLSKKQFQRAYDRLGGHLHAHNPWGKSKHMEQMAADLPSIIRSARGPIAIYAP